MPKIKRRNPIVMKKEERGRRRKSRREENTIQNLTIAAEQNIIDNNRFLYKRNLNSFTLTIIRVYNTSEWTVIITCPYTQRNKLTST